MLHIAYQPPRPPQRKTNLHNELILSTRSATSIHLSESPTQLPRPPFQSTIHINQTTIVFGQALRPSKKNSSKCTIQQELLDDAR
jgi:hypothetical protein